ncbi:histidine kinase [Aquiflexum sp.]|uniref:tetratricopeptide repeat-containing sensor histidine kinase n=1 Tax=Aquiflexum sp. TaxID=1872584 RepID=UPI0035933179
MNKVCFLVILLLGVNFPIYSQNSDSLLLAKATKAFDLAAVNSDSAYNLANEALHDARRNTFNKGIANSYNALGWVFMHKGNLDSSVYYLNLSRDVFAKENFLYDVARVDINLTEVMTKQSRFGEALVFALEADSLSLALKDVPLQTDTKRLLGILYREQGDNKKSVEYFNEAIKGFEFQGDLRRSVNTAISLSILLRKINMVDSSLTVLEKCLKIIEGKENNEYQLAMVREHLGDTFYMKQLFEESLSQYIMAYELFDKLGNKADMAYEALVIGKAQIALEKYKEAEYFLNQAFFISDTLDFLNYQFDAASELANLYKETGQWQKAFVYLNMAGIMKDSLDQQKQLENMIGLKEKYESEKQDQEIALLKSNMELENSRTRRRMQFQIFAIFLFLASLGIAYLIFNRYRLKQELNEQMLRNQISSDLHDEIGSTLSSIDVNSRIALLKMEDKETVIGQLQKIQQNARSIMDNLTQIVWSINPNNDSLEKLIFRMKDFAAEILEPLGIQYAFHQGGNLSELNLNPVFRKNIYLIFKEAVNNCAKYSSATEVLISLEVKNNLLFIEIADNGVGFNYQRELNKSNGLLNMENRAKQIQAKFELKTEPERGTMIKLEAPVT